MYGEIQGGLAAVKSTLELLKAGKEVIDRATVASGLADVHEKLLIAQSAAFEAMEKQVALLDQLRDLEKRLAAKEEWAILKQRYAMAVPWQGGIVYALKRARSDGQPPHWICTACFEDSRRSILNDEESRSATGGPAKLFVGCPVCKVRIQSPWAGGSVERKYAEDMTSRPA